MCRREPPPAAGSSTGSNGVPVRSTTQRSARLPARSEPTSSASPSAAAEPSVASSSTSVGAERAGSSARARACASAARISANMSIEGAVAGLSVPSPTRTPAASRSSDRGDPAAEERVRARAVGDGDAVLRQGRSISSASTVTQWTATRRSLRRPAPASARAPVVPGGGTRNEASAANAPVPSTQPVPFSAALSARCVATGRPSPRQAAYSVGRRRVGSVRRDAEPDAVARATPRCARGSARSGRRVARSSPPKTSR